MKAAKQNSNQDFRLLLQQEFVSRCRKNPAYSLRAYARALGIDASPLSGILRGKRPISAKMRQRLGASLGLSLEEIMQTRIDHKRAQQQEYQQLTLDSYSIISDWYHYAILEMIRIKEFKPSIRSVAKALNISPTETQIAIERLKRVGLLEITDQGKWIDTSANGLATNISGELTSDASKKLQRQILEKAIYALENVPIHARNNTSMSFALNPEDLPAAKERIKQFRRELCAFFEKNTNPKQVYQLGIALYPVSHLEV